VLFVFSISEVCTPEDSMSWDEQGVEGMVDNQQPSVYITNRSSDTPSRITVQHVGEFNWNSTFGQARLIQGMLAVCIHHRSASLMFSLLNVQPGLSGLFNSCGKDTVVPAVYECIAFI
jgi:hypothetical protein